MAKLTKVEGIGPAYAQSLREAGIRTTGALINKGATPEGRQEIAEQTGIGEDLILRWIRNIDLYRISGIGAEYAELLEIAGAYDVPSLAALEPEPLYRTLAQVNREEELVRKLPTRYQIQDWIKQARRLAPLITY